MNKREILAVLAVVATAGMCAASPVCSNLGGKHNEYTADWNPTAADYISDGLVALWDGIENAGWGIHDDNATEWIDLTGHGFDLPISGEAILPEAVKFSKSHVRQYDSLVFDGHAVTLQCVIDRSETTGNFCILGFGYVTSRLFFGDQTKYGARFGPGYTSLDIEGALNSVTMTREDNNSAFSLYDGANFVGWLTGNPSSISSYRLNINGENAYGNYRNVFSAHCIRLYNRALTPLEIQYNALIDKKRFGL